MKTISFLTILALAVLTSFCPLFAEDISERYEQDEDIIQPDEIPTPAFQIIPHAPEAKDDPAPREKKTKKQAAFEKKQAKEAARQARIDEKKAKAEAKKQAKIEEKARKAAEKEAEKKAKEDAKLKAQEDSMAKRAERAKLEEELEQKRLTDAQRKEKLYKKIDGIEQERNVEYRQKKGTRDKAPASLEQRPFETVPEEVTELIKKGDEYYNNKDYDKAREHYDKARFLVEEKKKKK
ncbi:MAG: hypothetical protein KKD29_04760 [Candidatus Omnitrophica bacterium]|nr:hypothetical protein [Candidatus Omnitrophota bacterium]MBU4488941.1 hypothetical protein [Candidatus Omnitrophota bacterium]